MEPLNDRAAESDDERVARTTPPVRSSRTAFAPLSLEAAIFRLHDLNQMNDAKSKNTGGHNLTRTRQSADWKAPPSASNRSSCKEPKLRGPRAR